jgi:hypothetical protein
VRTNVRHGYISVAVVSDTFTVTVALQLSGSLTSASANRSAAVRTTLRHGYVSVAVVSDTATVTVASYFVCVVTGITALCRRLPLLCVQLSSRLKQHTVFL